MHDSRPCNGRWSRRWACTVNPGTAFSIVETFHCTDAPCQAMCKNLQAAEAWRVSPPTGWWCGNCNGETSCSVGGTLGPPPRYKSKAFRGALQMAEVCRRVMAAMRSSTFLWRHVRRMALLRIGCPGGEEWGAQGGFNGVFLAIEEKWVRWH